MIAALKSGTIKIFNVVTKDEISSIFIENEIVDLIHPPTYINKILVVGKTQVELWNVLSGNKIYSFQDAKKLNKYFLNNEVTCVEMSPIIDFAAVGFVDGTILILNLKKAKVVSKFNQDGPVVSLAFSKNIKTEPV